MFFLTFESSPNLGHMAGTLGPENCERDNSGPGGPQRASIRAPLGPSMWTHKGQKMINFYDKGPGPSPYRGASGWEAIRVPWAPLVPYPVVLPPPGGTPMAWSELPD